MSEGDHLNFISKIPEDDEIGKVVQVETPGA
jgi:hypothetical protein